MTRCDINKELFRAKYCSSKIAIKYINSVRYGYSEKAKKYFNTLVFLNSVIRIFNEYKLDSDNISLSLVPNSTIATLSEEEINCVSEEQLCILSKKVSSICSTC